LLGVVVTGGGDAELAGSPAGAGSLVLAMITTIVARATAAATPTTSAMLRRRRSPVLPSGAGCAAVGRAGDDGDARVASNGKTPVPGRGAGAKDVSGAGTVRRPRVGPAVLDRPSRGERAVLVEQRGQVDALDQAHVDEQPTVDLAVVVDRDDMWLGQLGGQRRLTPKPGPERLVVGQVAGKAFDRHGPALDGVHRSVDLAHAAARDEPFQPVPTKHLGGHAA
jgi:hypothetical protein